MKVLGIDYGKRKVGLALGDADSGIAVPFKTLAVRNVDQLIADLKMLCQREKIDRIVIGWPANDHEASANYLEEVKNFTEKIATQILPDVISVDERFSTKQAQTMNREMDDDMLAAMIILQHYFDQQK